MATSTICGKTVKIIDTPGIFDGFKCDEQNVKDISKASVRCKDGIHAFVFVMDNKSYTKQCEMAIDVFLEFGGIEPFTFVLLTHAKETGATKAATDLYIEKVLSSPRCPSGLKRFMNSFERRVMMLESETTTEDYCVQKREEFIAMIKNISKNNGYKMYTHDILNNASKIYEHARLEQQQKIDHVKNKLKSNIEKINQLKKQLDYTSDKSSEVSKEIAELEKENRTHEKHLEHIEDTNYPGNRAEEIIIEGHNINDSELSNFMTSFADYIAKVAFLVPAAAAYHGAIGSGFGAAAGVVVPVVGPGAGAVIGGVAGGFVAGVGVFMVLTAQKVQETCIIQ